MTIHAASLWFEGEENRITPITIGNLNQTFVVENSHGRSILQRLNPIFAPEVNLDIEALTAHLSRNGIATTRLIPTLAGTLWGTWEGQCWRLLTFVQGENFSSMPSPQRAREAGQLVGNFHRAVFEFKHQYRFTRGNPHDTPGHMSKLRAALAQHASHARINEVRPLADQILSASQALCDLSTLPKRHSHGDLKINNIIFGATANSLIDLDTIGLMPWAVEMGDAFRSWCNPRGENADLVSFNENYFEAALINYANAVSDLWTRVEVEHLIEGVRAIPLELASRFLRDVLEDNYFGYDATKFASRSDHNWVRAKAQWSVYCDIEKKKTQLERMIKTAFA